MYINGVGNAGLNGTIAEMGGLDGYGLGMTSVTLNTDATVLNSCDECGGCCTLEVRFYSITTYSYPPAIISQPADCKAATDTNAVFKIGGRRITEYAWQKKTGGEFVPLEDTTLENQMEYAGTSTSTLAVNCLRYNENGAVYRCVMKGDNGEQLVSREAVLTVEDKTPPTAVIGKSPESWTKGNILLTVDAADLDTQLAEEAYSWDGGITYTAQNSNSVTENGEYIVSVRDQAGNCHTQNVVIDTIDRIVPTVSISANTLEKTYSPVKLFITANDLESGLHETAYFYNGRWNAQSEYSVAKNGMYEVIVRDAVGNLASTQLDVGNILVTSIPDDNDDDDDNNDDDDEDTADDSDDNDEKNDINDDSDENTVEEIVVKEAVPVTPIPIPKEKKKKETIEKKEIEIAKKEQQGKQNEKKVENIENTDKKEAAQENVKPKAVVIEKSDKKEGMVWKVLLCIGGILAVLLLLFILLFMVIVEVLDKDTGKYQLKGIKVLYLHKKCWEMSVKEVFDNASNVRLRFGILFVQLFEDWEINIIVKGERQGEIHALICKKLLIESKQIRRR